MMSSKNRVVLTLLVLGGLVSGACATVQPWQRGTARR